MCSNCNFPEMEVVKTSDDIEIRTCPNCEYGWTDTIERVMSGRPHMLIKRYHQPEELDNLLELNVPFIDGELTLDPEKVIHRINGSRVLKELWDIYQQAIRETFRKHQKVVV